MGILRLSIDTKSLYYNIKNDNQTGHTATVATPIKQGAAIRPELQMLSQIPESICPSSRESLISQILSNSRAKAKINSVYVFNRVAVNGHLLNNMPSYCMYVREETDRNSVHFGRQKLHYPLSLSFEDLDTRIDNKAVISAVSAHLKNYAFINTCIDNKTIISAISKHLNNYAFIVEAFEYDTDNNILNFDATIVGNNQVPYSKVFINRRGVGNKFSMMIADNTDNYDTEIIALREHLGYDNVTPDNYGNIVADNCILARDAVANYLSDMQAENIRLLKNEYPYSIYDIEYRILGNKKYAIVQQTATREKAFTLPTEKIQFINDFSENTFLFLVTDICDGKKIFAYSASDMNSLGKSIASIRFEDRK